MRGLILILLLPACGLAARLQTIVPFTAGTTIAALKFDATGNIYVAGSIKPSSPKSPFDTDAFVAKLSPDGSITLFRTALGGSSTEQINDIAIAPDGSIHAAGTTSSPDFPASGTLAASGSKAFYAHFDSTGALLTAIHLGDSGDTSGEGIALDSTGAVYVTGRLNTPASGAYVTKLDVSGNVVFTTTLTGGNHIALDGQGNIYISGTLLPPNLVPTTTGAFQTKAPLPLCANSSRDLPCFHQYVSKLDPGGKQLLYSTFVAGNREEGPTSLAVDAQGNAYLAGSTSSPDYPTTPGAYQPFSLAGPVPRPVVAVAQVTPDPVTGFVTKLNPTGSALVFSTYLGGSSMDKLSSIAVDNTGNVYIAGAAGSEDFPGFSGVPDRCASGAFVTRLSADGTSLSETQLLYGIPVLANSVIALDPAGKPWIAQSATLARVDLFGASQHFACAVDAADFAILNQVAPGQLIALFGDNIGLGDPVVATPPPGGNFPTAMGGIVVSFNGTPAPLLYVSPSQVNAQVPFEIAGQATVQMQINLQTASAAITETRNFDVVDRAPSVFILESGALQCGTQRIGGWHPAAYNADGTLNSCQNPAVRGSTVTLYVQGLGVTAPTQTTGAVVATPPQSLNLAVSNTDGTARFVAATGAPGLISAVWALQLQIPNGQTTNFTIAGRSLRETTLVIWSK